LRAGGIATVEVVTALVVVVEAELVLVLEPVPAGVAFEHADRARQATAATTMPRAIRACDAGAAPGGRVTARA
jgi:hypothetical protein